ncbi:MAG TPA: hypothetical protein VIK61_06855 [Acidimicrobiia bacterium]
MQRPHSRRIAAGLVVIGLAVPGLAACHSGGGTSGGTAPGPPDVKAACGAFADLGRSVEALNGVDVSDPAASVAALTRAVNAYSAALLTFERVGPTNLRVRAAEVRAAVLAHHFGQAAAARVAIDTWAAEHCKP